MRFHKNNTIDRNLTEQDSKYNPVNQSALEALLRRQDVWRGSTISSQQATVSTGYKDLDESLNGRGWPLGALIDVSQISNGHGEWQLFGPALAKLSHQAGLIILVNPPALPYGPGVAQYGINYQALKVVRCCNRQAVLSALVDAMQAQCCLSILTWEGQFNWRYSELRKLQLSASQSSSLCVCFRRQRPSRVQSPSPLRLHAQLCQHGLQIQLLKQRGQYRPKLCILPITNFSVTDHGKLVGDKVASVSTQTNGQRGSSKILKFNRSRQTLPTIGVAEE